MGSDAHVVVVGGSTGSPALAHRRLDELEATWSRFRADSEVSRLNAAAGTAVEVSPETWLLLYRAIEGIDLTGGRFDPTILRDVEALGYDRSFDQLDRRGATGQRTERVPPVHRGVLRGSAAITVFDDRRSVRLAAGTGFDPGGIGKGLAADLVVAELLAEGAEGASVNVGGDVRAEGRSPTPDGWVVAVEDPWTRSRELSRCALRSGAVATSSRCERTWTRGGVEHHHLVDPGTGRSVDSGLAAVTVVAGEGWLAEVATKAAFVAGAAHAPELVRSLGVTALLVADDGTVEAVDMPDPGVAA
jgi:thiamine biosynthesis lipoprotein